MQRAPAEVEGTRDKGKAIVETVERGARRLDWTVRIPSRGEIDVGGELQPTPKRAIGAAIDADDDSIPAAPALWWYLSGLTHPGIHALVQHVVSTGGPDGFQQGAITVDGRQLLIINATVGRGVRAALTAYRHLFGAAPETSRWDEVQAAWSRQVLATIGSRQVLATIGSTS